MAVFYPPPGVNKILKIIFFKQKKMILFGILFDKTNLL